jgi:hypothetical protein
LISGLLSSVGNKPKCTDKEYYRYFTMAPMCRYAEDLPLLLRNVLCDPNKEALLELDKPVTIINGVLYGIFDYKVQGRSPGFAVGTSINNNNNLKKSDLDVGTRSLESTSVHRRAV